MVPKERKEKAMGKYLITLEHTPLLGEKSGETRTGAHHRAHPRKRKVGSGRSYNMQQLKSNSGPDRKKE